MTLAFAVRQVHERACTNIKAGDSPEHFRAHAWRESRPDSGCEVQLLLLEVADQDRLKVRGVRFVRCTALGITLISGVRSSVSPWFQSDMSGGVVVEREPVALNVACGLVHAKRTQRR